MEFFDRSTKHIRYLKKNQFHIESLSLEKNNLFQRPHCHFKVYIVKDMFFSV